MADSGRFYLFNHHSIEISRDQNLIFEYNIDAKYSDYLVM